jgi:hypothetical protein
MKRIRRERGSTFVTAFMLMTLLAAGVAAYVSSATQSLRTSRQQSVEIQMTHLCEAGVQRVLRDLWRPFKVAQSFTDIDTRTAGSGTGSPTVSMAGEVTGIGRYAAGVISATAPNNDPFLRRVVVRSVAWIDSNGNGQLDAGETQKIVDVVANYQLLRSKVFDYAYFVNNYGWMDGFQPTWMYVNGDMRANGNFDFLNGSPTVNGSVYASQNQKLVPAAPGLLNQRPLKQTNDAYHTDWGSGGTGQPTFDNQRRRRPSYRSSVHGTKGSAEYELWRPYIFESGASIVNGTIDGAVAGDVTGIRAWARTALANQGTSTMLDTASTKEVIMPNLSDLNYYQQLSQSWTDTKATFRDGTANPHYGQGAWLEVWNSNTNSYQRITTDGNFNGSAVLVGTSTRPIRIHGPVTFSQDVLIKGHVEGQGTIYTGRNVHVVGSIVYTNKPDFRTDNLATFEQTDKRDMLGLAARGSVIFGNTNAFTNTVLQYMRPPFTRQRYDEDGNLLPAYNGTVADETGTLRYKTVLGDTIMGQVAEQVIQIDAVIYTNFVGGGHIGGGGQTVLFNGSLICKDEAIVVWSLPLVMNYDVRIKERGPNDPGLIDLVLPRSPAILRSTWQDRGFYFNGANYPNQGANQSAD